MYDVYRYAWQDACEMYCTYRIDFIYLYLYLYLYIIYNIYLCIRSAYQISFCQIIYIYIYIGTQKVASNIYIYINMANIKMYRS